MIKVSAVEITDVDVAEDFISELQRTWRHPRAYEATLRLHLDEEGLVRLRRILSEEAAADGNLLPPGPIDGEFVDE